MAKYKIGQLSGLQPNKRKQKSGKLLKWQRNPATCHWLFIQRCVKIRLVVLSARLTQ